MSGSDLPASLTLKLERAESHRAEFKEALGMGPDAVRRFVSERLQKDDDGRLYFRTDAPEPGPQHGIILGEMIHQLRSCLDHVIYSMVQPLTNDTRVLRKVDFPIYVDRDLFNESGSVKKLRNVLGPTSPAFTAILAWQPYEREAARKKPKTTDPLWYLSELDNIDKHRTIVVLNPTVTAQVFIMKDGLLKLFYVSKQPLKAGTATLDLGPSAPEPPFEVPIERVTRYLIVEGTGVCDRLSVFPIITDMFKNVRGVIDDFRSKGLI